MFYSETSSQALNCFDDYPKMKKLCQQYPTWRTLKGGWGGGGEKREGEPLVARFLSLLIPVTSGPGTLFYIYDRHFNSFVHNLIKL